MAWLRSRSCCESHLQPAIFSPASADSWVAIHSLEAVEDLLVVHQQMLHSNCSCSCDGTQDFSGLVAWQDRPEMARNGETYSAEAMRRCSGAIKTDPQVLRVRHNLQGCHGHVTRTGTSLGSHTAKEEAHAGGCLCLPPCSH